MLNLKNHLLNLKKSDIEIYNILIGKERYQEEVINLTASENYVSKSVLEATGSIFTNKYAEGYPGKRYYGGCKFEDLIENIAIESGKKLFKVEHANVQPHSGSQANQAVLFALLKPGDTILSMNLAHGGHLSHGSPVNISGKWFNIVHYGVDKNNELIDYNQVQELALQYKPRLIICGGSAYSRIIDFKKFREISDSINAYLLADIAHIAGLVAVGLHPSPVNHAHFITTTTHKTLRGPRGGMILCNKEKAKDSDKTLDKLIDSAIFPGIQGGPLMHVIAAKAVAFREALKPEFFDYQLQILKNSETLAKWLQSYSFRLVSGGTENHLMLLDLTNKDIAGKDAQNRLEEVDIIVNKNLIPYDTKSATITSGIRIGVPAVTTRGMKEAEMVSIANFIYSILMNKRDKEFVRSDVKKLCWYFPIYKEDRKLSSRIKNKLISFLTS